MSIMELYKVLGEDGERANHRFGGNSGLLERFVRKFVADPSYENLKRAEEEGDIKALEIYAHTLKGTGGNLGFQKLSDCSSELVITLRSGAINPEAITSMVAAIGEEYNRVMEAIAHLD